MASDLNKVQLIGRLGQTPDVRHTQTGGKVVTLSLATSESWKDKVTNERKEKTEWHRIVIFNERLAELAEAFLRKGSRVYIEGQLQSRKWTDKNGVERTTTEIVMQKFHGEIIMLDSKEAVHEDTAPDDGYSNFGPVQVSYKPRDESKTGSMKNFATDINDGIPF